MPAARPVTFGCTTICSGACGVTVPVAGRCTNQLLPSSVRREELKVKGVVPGLYTVNVCEPGEAPPATAVNTSPAGCTTGPRLTFGGNTLSTVATTCGALPACGAEMDTLS